MGKIKEFHLFAGIGGGIYGGSLLGHSWGVKEAFSRIGVNVSFLCEEYIEDKYNQK